MAIHHGNLFLVWSIGEVGIRSSLGFIIYFKVERSLMATKTLKAHILVRYESYSYQLDQSCTSIMIW